VNPLRCSTIVSVLSVFAGTLVVPARAQDAERGAQLYMQLPSAPSCVSCHGPDPAASRNNLLHGADAPLTIRKALVNVGAMGYLGGLLSTEDVADIAAFLGRVNQAASYAPLAVWPLTADFGTLGFGTVSPEQRMRLKNHGTQAIPVGAPVVRGVGFQATSDCPAQLEPGASCSLRVRHEATAVGTSTGAVSVATGATPLPMVLALVARTQPAARAVLGWSPPETEVVLAPVAVGASAAIQRTLTNAGAADTVLGATTLIGPGAHALRTSGCAAGSTLAPAASCVLTVRHEPSVALDAHAMLQLRSDGANPPALVIAAPAQAGSDPPTPPPEPPAATGGGAVGVALLALLVSSIAALFIFRSRVRRERVATGPDHRAMQPARR
jgi:hypothetical protein